MEQNPEFLAFKAKSNVRSTTTEPDTTGPIEERTPCEVMEDAYATIRTQLAGELLERIAQSSPQFFERLVVDLLVNMGYGGTRKDAGEAVGGRGDGGIDGIIKEDRLGLEVVCIQAKR